jgi:hypothetical protein
MPLIIILIYISHWSFASLFPRIILISNPYALPLHFHPISHWSFSPLFRLCLILLIPISHWPLSFDSFLLCHSHPYYLPFFPLIILIRIPSLLCRLGFFCRGLRTYFPDMTMWTGKYSGSGLI